MPAVKQDSSLAIFGVLLGLALTEFILAQFTSFPRKPIDISPVVAWSLFAALVSLLLRYFIGSAVHIKRTYVYSTPHDKASWFLLKDLSFLVLFGVYAVAISQSGNPPQFMARSSALLAIAFVWSLTDPAFHLALIGKPPSVPLWTRWIWINLGQLLITLLLLSLSVHKWKAFSAVLLGVIYSVAFGLEYVLDLPRGGPSAKGAAPNVPGLKFQILAGASLVLFIASVLGRVLASTPLLSYGRGLILLAMSIVGISLCDVKMWQQT